MEPSAIVGAGIAVLGSKDLLNKLLGPTADYVGGEIRGLVEKCNVNLDNIFRNAAEKAGKRLNDPGVVNPRVLKSVINEGRFREDTLSAEYFGGILAASRTSDGRDDRGAVLLETVNHLSCYQLRFHFVVYLAFNRLFQREPINLGDAHELRTMKLFVPLRTFSDVMRFEEGEVPGTILSHCLAGLSKECLIGEDCISGTKEFLEKHKYPAAEDGIVVSPTLHGSELFVWAVGMQGASGRELLTITINGDVDGVPFPSEAARIQRSA